jgi:hypothetical protein
VVLFPKRERVLAESEAQTNFCLMDTEVLPVPKEAGT